MVLSVFIVYVCCFCQIRFCLGLMYLQYSKFCQGSAEWPPFGQALLTLFTVYSPCKMYFSNLMLYSS